MLKTEKDALYALLGEWRDEANATDRPYGDGLLKAAERLQVTLDGLVAAGGYILLDTLTGKYVLQGNVSVSALYERGPDGDQYRYQPIKIEGV